MTGTTWLKQCWSTDEKNFTWFYSAFFIIIMGFPGGSYGKESICNAGDLGSIRGLGRSSHLHTALLGLVQTHVHRESECPIMSQRRPFLLLSSIFPRMKKQKISRKTHSALLKCYWLKIKNMASLDKHRRRQWHPTPVLLPGKSHRRRSLVGCSPWSC